MDNYIDIDTDQVYNIEYIAKNGVLQHSHILEKDLEITEDKLPPELIFLNILSLHFSGAKKLDSNLLLSMMQGDYFLRNKKTLHNLDAKWKKLLKI